MTGKSFPNIGKSFPKTGKSFPKTGKSFPKTGKSFPNVGKSFPNVGKSFPNVGKSFPSLGKSFSSLGKSFPKTVCSFPNLEKSFSKTLNSSANQGNWLPGRGASPPPQVTPPVRNAGALTNLWPMAADRTFPFDSGGRRLHFLRMDLTSSRWLPIVLLTVSNIFMTFAWYGHLKFKGQPLLLVILASWGIAFFEYCFMVPANRWGNSVYSATQLKIIQEVITLSVFVVFAIFYLGEKIRWNYVAALVCILAAVAFTFLPKE